MTPRFVVRSAAEADLAQAIEWYEQRSPGLGLEFLRAVEVTFASIARAPEAFPRLHEDIRRARLRRFPYGVFSLRSARTSACWRSCMPIEIRGAGSRAPEGYRPHLATCNADGCSAPFQPQ